MSTPHRTPNPLWVAFRRDPFFWLLFVLSTVGAVVPFWRTAYLPFLDAPQHLLTIAIIDGVGTPGVDAFYSVDLASTQYLLYYLTCDLLADLFGVEHANTIFLSIYAVLLPWSVLYAIEAFGRLRAAALLAIPLTFNTFLFYGFVNYVFAFPLLFFAMGLAQRACLAPSRSWWREAGLAALAVLSFYSHLQVFLVHIGAVGLVVLASRPAPRAFILRLSHLVPALVLFAFWALGSSGLAGGEAWEGAVGARYASLTGAKWEPLDQTLSQVPARLMGVYKGHTDERYLVAVAIGLLLLFFFRGGRNAAGPSTPTDTPERPRSWAPEAFVLFMVLFYVCLPDSYKWIWPVNWRFAPVAALGMLLMGTASVPRWVHHGLTALFGAIAIGSLAMHSDRFAAFGREAGEFDEIVASVEPESRLVSVIFASHSEVVEGPAYLHFGQYPVIRHRGGVAVYSFAEAPQSPIRFVPRDKGGPPPTQLRSEWKPNEFRLTGENRYYDYILVRGEPPGFQRRAGFDASVSLVKRVGAWTLYRHNRHGV